MHILCWANKVSPSAPGLPGTLISGWARSACWRRSDWAKNGPSSSTPTRLPPQQIWRLCTSSESQRVPITTLSCLGLWATSGARTTSSSSAALDQHSHFLMKLWHMAMTSCQSVWTFLKGNSPKWMTMRNQWVVIPAKRRRSWWADDLTKDHLHHLHRLDYTTARTVMNCLSLLPVWYQSISGPEFLSVSSLHQPWYCEIFFFPPGSLQMFSGATWRAESTATERDSISRSRGEEWGLTRRRHERQTEVRCRSLEQIWAAAVQLTDGYSTLAPGVCTSPLTPTGNHMMEATATSQPDGVVPLHTMNSPPLSPASFNPFAQRKGVLKHSVSQESEPSLEFVTKRVRFTK